ncbi:MAG: DUF86 domain-containing protein [Anaerolineales bacterium]|nr:DUF86 domain-containing protein [Anaerolineales bacterium]
MLPSKLSKRVVTDRLAWIDRMLAEIRSLPLGSQSSFMADSRNIWATESCRRRPLEALFDLGRHVTAKGFGEAVTEYKEIASALSRHGIVSMEKMKLMQKLAGYRNRLVHFYHDVSAEELYEICSLRLGDVEKIADALRTWIKDHPNELDESL